MTLGLIFMEYSGDRTRGTMEYRQLADTICPLSIRVGGVPDTPLNVLVVDETQ